MTRSKKTAPAPDLPDGVTADDTKYPEFGAGLGYDKFEALGLGMESGFGGYLTFYRVAGRHAPGWVLTTLHISNPGRRSAAGATARFYGVGVADGKVYTVGRGPHVTATVKVYLTKANLERLRRYVELWKRGMADALVIRDRISSRRAQGQLRRSFDPLNAPWDS